MDFASEFFPLFIIYLAILLAIIGFKGFHYDQLKKGKDRNYKKNHSFLIHQGRFGTVMPFPIKDNSKDPKIKKALKQYNHLAFIFWVSIIVLIIAYIILN